MREIRPDKLPGIYMDMLAGDRSLLRRVFGRHLALFFEVLSLSIFLPFVYVFLFINLVVYQTGGHGTRKNMYYILTLATPI